MSCSVTLAAVDKHRLLLDTKYKAKAIANNWAAAFFRGSAWQTISRQECGLPVFVLSSSLSPVFFALLLKLC